MEASDATQTERERPGRPIGQTAVCALAVFVGVAAGVVSALFRWLIGLFHNLFFLGEPSILYNANAHTPPSPWGPAIIAVPVLGGLAVVWLTRRFAPEAKGHGVPEVIDAVYYNKGVIRPIVVLIKALASALCIGSGGSVGREGPIIQMGSAFGSSVGQWLRIPAWQRVTLIASGAGGGIAATFNTPIGGILFAAEIILHEISVRTLVPVALATATATYVGRWFFGATPSFTIPALEQLRVQITDPLILPSYLLLGLLAGLASAGFIRSLYAFEDFFEERIPKNEYLRHALGMLPVGLMMFALFQATGRYHVGGIGYATVQQILQGGEFPLALAAVLFALKLTATSLTLGSGGSGGIFSPCLFLGATLGVAWASFVQGLFDGLPVSAPAFAVAGMAGLVGGATGAAITAVVMTFEMTLDYSVIVPMTLTVAVSYGLRKALLRESIYTMKLARRGHYVPEALQTNFHYMRLARDLKSPDVIVVSAETPLRELAPRIPERRPYPCFLAAEGSELRGVATVELLLQAIHRGRKDAPVSKVASQAFSVISPKTTLFEIVTLMRADRVELFLVAPEGRRPSTDNIQGWISKERVADSMREAIGLLAS